MLSATSSHPEWSWYCHLPIDLSDAGSRYIRPFVNPSISLVNKLKSLNIKAEYLSSSQSRSEIKRILSSLTSYAANLNKKNALPLPCHLLYITPERLMLNEFQNLLSTLYDSHVLVLFAIDEAHCISTYCPFAFVETAF